MKAFFTATLLLLVLLSVAAWKMQPVTVPDGKTPLVWSSDDNPARRDQIALFNKAHPDLFWQLDPNNTGLQKVIVQSLAGVGPDIFDGGGGILSSLIDADIAWDITDELKKRGFDPEKEVWKGVQYICMQNGRIYGIPTNAAANALFINKALFDKSGVPYPTGAWTWKEFLPVAQKLTIRDERGRAKQFGFLMDWWLWPQFVLQWGGSVFSEDGTRCTLDSPEAIAGVQFLHDLMYKYKVMPSPVEEAAMATSGGWGSGTITQFGDGKKVAMALGGRWWLCTLRNKEQFPNLTMTVCEAPYYNRRVFLAYGRASFINKHSPRREEALNHMLFMLQRPYNDLINDQADGLAAVKQFCYSDHFMKNPEFPEEDKNDVWRSVMEAAEPNLPSPFANAQSADRIINRQMDLIKNNQKSVPDALRDAAREVNEEIQKTLAKNPDLKQKYDAAIARQKGQG
jgi:multiple sugar transport system substrate-binding protein